MTDTQADMVEAVARAIDPKIWVTHDDIAGRTWEPNYDKWHQKWCEDSKRDGGRWWQSLETARAAIAAMQPHIDKASGEPVAWIYRDQDGFYEAYESRAEHLTQEGWNETPLYPPEAIAKAYEAGQRDMRERAAEAAAWAHMVPPDGGSPSDEEREVADEAARRIRALGTGVREMASAYLNKHGTGGRNDR